MREESTESTQPMKDEQHTAETEREDARLYHVEAGQSFDIRIKLRTTGHIEFIHKHTLLIHSTRVAT